MLLLTDRLSHALELKQVVDTAEPCAILVLGQGPGQAADHAILVCDVALDRPAALAATRAVLERQRPGRTVPLLLLSRRGGATALAEARAIDATAVLPHDASHAQVLFTVRRLIESSRDAATRASSPSLAAIAAEAREVGAAFSDMFDAARGGRDITTASLEQGGNSVIAAVGGGRIGAWLDVVRKHDDITYQHCLLVAGLAAAFSIQLGLSLKGQRLIAQAALVHDIGKANIPPAILQKPSGLTAAEMAVIRTHPAIGYDMLVRQGGFDPQLLDIVRHHHEYIDGTGYPDGLSGAAVSPVSRLVTICDIYAAMIERRAYKPPASPAEAFGILVGMGGKLDVALVAAFRQVAGIG